MKNLTLITGGVRSGKSSYAIKKAEFYNSPLYIATGWADDNEMAIRIQKHKEERCSKWTTIEEKFEIWKSIEKSEKLTVDFILVDCITMWISNLMLNNRNIEDSVKHLINALTEVKLPVMLVTNEVGLGIVPTTETGRLYRDLLGWTNQKLAAKCDNLIFMISGIPMRIK